MSTTLTANLEERIDDTTLRRVREEVAGHDAQAVSTAATSKGWLSRWFENSIAQRIGQRHLATLAAERGRVTEAWKELPQRMHLVANQTRLMLELVDDFRSGKYRKIPWHSLAIGAAAILYTANPVDVIPDAIVGIGVLDDVLVAALAARVLRNDLRAYCEFKGYRVEDYFPATA
ncbi:MAG TPA: DUF1232 domain-containing protein [Polyangiales bacterium]|nr:DUF1232 domain-containing protein [Polyangiales bacterium]